MKKLLTSAFLLVFGVSVAFAQNTDNDQISVSVNLVPALTITPVTNLSYGNVTMGSTNPVMSATTGALTAGSSTGTVAAGAMNVQGAPGESVTIDWDNTVNLVNGGSTVVYTPAVAGKDSGASTYTALTDGGTFTLSGTQGGTTAVTHNLQIGGSLDISGATTAGSHTGNLTVTVTYTSL